MPYPTYDSMLQDYANTFRTVKNLYIYDANSLINRFTCGFYAPLNELASIEHLFFIAASQPQDDVLFWEFIESFVSPDTSDKILVSYDRAYAMFKADVWDAFLNQCLNEDIISRASFVAHLKKSVIYVAVGE